MLQNWIHRLTEGKGDRTARLLAALLGFIALALFYDLRSVPAFSSQEAMETAQLARNIADGKGYTTLSIRPVNLYLLNKQSTNVTDALDKPMPELATPPVYPMLLAGFFKALPYHFGGHQIAPWDLETWVMGLNQALLFIAALLLFRLASRLFDNSVAWLAAGLLVATDLIWQFSLSGLHTLLLINIFILLIGRLARLDELEHAVPQVGGLGTSLAAGALIGIGGLTSYSFAWLVIPTALFILISGAQGRVTRCAAMLLAFALVMVPWLVRNVAISGTLFGSAGYAVFQGTYPFPEDSLERTFNLTYSMARIDPADFVDKLFTNVRQIFADDLPKLAGNWISAFFLVGLLVPFRKPVLSRIRYFALGTLVLLIVVQALGRTHLTSDRPVLNSENLLVLLAPVVFVFGAAFFFTLIEQLHAETPALRPILVGLFGTVVCAPFLLVFLTRPNFPPPAFDSRYIQRIVNWTSEKDVMVSDVPSAVAWYGSQGCVWLPLNNRDQFEQLNKLKPVKAVYLTQRTTDHCMSQNVRNPGTWERFALECWARGEVPDTFPLTNAPTGFLPERFFISASDRWSTGKN